MKLVHTADIHLDSPLRGLERYEGAPVAALRGATRRALENLVGMCLAERVDVLLVAGDLFDGSWRDYGTGLFFAAQMARLRTAGIPVVMVRGNHDAQSQVARTLELPDNVRDLDTRRPERVTFERLGLAVCGQGFGSRAVTDDLAARYPDPVPGLFNVALLHTSADGREGHEPYAPCSPAMLTAKGYDYWALGHVHAREVVSMDPWVVFPGNLQGRHARETGPKGASVVTVEAGRVVAVEHRVLDAVRWCVCEVGAAAAADAHDVVDLARESLERGAAEADGRAVAARVVVHGATRAHAALQADPVRWENEVRAVALDVGEGGVWVEKVRLRTSAMVDAEAVAARGDVVGHVARALRALRDDEARLAAAIDDLADLRHKLPPEAREGEAGVRLEDPEYVREVLADVERMLLTRLAGKVEE